MNKTFEEWMAEKEYMIMGSQRILADWEEERTHLLEIRQKFIDLVHSDYDDGRGNKLSKEMLEGV